MPEVLPSPRRRGAQPGNLNATPAGRHSTRIRAHRDQAKSS